MSERRQNSHENHYHAKTLIIVPQYHQIANQHSLNLNVSLDFFFFFLQVVQISIIH